MRYKFFFLLAFAFLILLPLDNVSAACSGTPAVQTCTRGDVMPQVYWSISGGPTTCTLSTTYPGVLANPSVNDGVESEWSGNTATATGSKTFAGKNIWAGSGTYDFSCRIGATVSSIAKLIVTDCLSGTTWSDATKTCVAPPAPTLTLTANPVTLPFGGGNTRVTWVTTGATFCDAWNGDASWDSFNPSHLGGFSDRTISATTTFTMRCWNSVGVSTGAPAQATVTVSPPPGATIVPVVAGSTTCFIAANQSTCNVGINWTFTNATNPNIYNQTRNKIESQNVSIGNGVSIPITNGNNTIQARDNTSVLNVIVGTASCVGGTTWDGTKCAPDPTLTFSASPLNLPAGGGNTTLSWRVDNADWCYQTNWTGIGSGSFIGAIAPGTTWTSLRNINTSTTFQLQCGNSVTNKSTAVMTATVIVASTLPPATVSMSFSPNTINEGQSTTVTWVTTNAVGCWGYNGDPSWTGPKNPAGGSQLVTPVIWSNTYSIDCWDANGVPVTWDESINIIPAGPPANVILNAFPPSVTLGGSTTLNWNALNGTSCLASGGTPGWAGWKSSLPMGTEVATPVVDTTYSMQCWNSAGQSMGQRNMLVTVMMPPPSDVLFWTNDPTMITAGTPVTLEWTPMMNPTSCTATDGWSGPKNVLGSTEAVSPLVDTTYTLECQNALGQSMGPRSVWVMVIPPAATGTVSANPLTCTIPQGQGTCDVDVTWNIISASTPNIYNTTTGYSIGNPSGNSVAFPVTFGFNTIQARDGIAPIMGADVNVSATCSNPSDFWDGSMCASAGCTPSLYCTNYPTEIANTCQGSDYSFTDDCGDAQLCPGTRVCNYNWKEIAP